MAEQRPLRMCDSCGGVDDHPRHVVAYAVGDGVSPPAVATKALKAAQALGDEAFDAVLAQVQDTSVIQKHMDCCRADGCPDGTCPQVTAGAEDKRGDALVKHLTKGK